MDQKVGVLCFCLNEIEALRIIAPELQTLLSEQKWKYELIFIDGNSEDGSYEFLTNRGLNVVQQGGPGIPQALIDGFNAAKNLNCSHIVQFQPDGNCDPQKLPELVSALLNDGTEIVIGSRYFTGRKSIDDTLTTAFGNTVFTWIYRIKFPNKKLTDVLVGFKGYRIGLVDELDLLDNREYNWLERLLKVTFSYDTILLLRGIRSGSIICEIDARECPRIGGHPKRRTFRWGFVFLCQLLFDNQFRARVGKARF